MRQLITLIRKFFLLSDAEVKLFFEALFTLYKIKFLLGLISFPHLRKFCRLKAAHKIDPIQISLCQNALHRAKKLTPWKRSICLVDALSLQCMLGKRGISSELVLGVAKKAQQMSAHAWLERDGVDLIGGRGRNQFTSVASFPSMSK